ncbi:MULTISPECIES: hypothetical protein [unclassified Variovorax]|jgi:hypothetical protein|uniref:hypothetical protein n=1 Tax=unclassified Variovorax TaxID=663243 RepID=UPI0015A55E1F|nr:MULTISPECIES: hypothetical protein [unclassified Variovorax]
MRFRPAAVSLNLGTALLLSSCACVAGHGEGMQRNVGQYYIQSGYIYGPRMSGKYYILNRHIYGPRNNGAYYLQIDYDPKKFGPFYIWGPKKGGQFYVQGNYIFGPPGDLPWLDDDE